MSTMNQTDFFTIVQERHSVKQFDPAYKLSEQEIEHLLKIASSAPSAWNLQHWKFLAITEQPVKEKLLPIAYGQQQVVEASTVIAILGDLRANLNVEAVYEPAVQAGTMPEAVKEDMVRQIDYAYANVPTVSRDDAIRNASLAAMQLMLAAKAKGLDSCPMGGFDSNKLVEAFCIPMRYIPVMLVAIGKAAALPYPSNRLPIEQSIIWNHF